MPVFLAGSGSWAQAGASRAGSGGAAAGFLPKFDRVHGVMAVDQRDKASLFL